MSKTKITESQIEWLKKKGRVIMTFKLRIAAVIGTVVLGSIPSFLILSQPLQVRLTYATIGIGMAMACTPYIQNSFATPIIQMISITLDYRRHKPVVYTTTKIETLKKKMHVPDSVQVFITESKWVTGPYCNMLSGNVYLPKSWLSVYHESEILGALAHEFGHSTRRNRFNITNMAFFAILLVYSIYVVVYTIPGIGQMAAIALEMLVLTWIARNNEFRADWDGAKGAGPEGLISLFESLLEAHGSDGSETHPSLPARIERLTKLLD